MNDERLEGHTFSDDVKIALRGLFMGGADVIPGVSGGTVALISGIYERLVTAISHFDLTLLGHLRGGQWKLASRHIDLRFLVALAFGIGCGFVIMTLLMHELLTDDETRMMTMAAFFGMILASAVLVARLIEVRSTRHLTGLLAIGVLAAVVAYWLSTRPNSQLDPSLPYVFFCGSVAICAMILPGISGAMILLILGIYVHLTEIPGNLLHGKEVAEGLIQIAVFGSACAMSIVCFSKVLRWLLVAHKATTMAVLCGFMFGALRKLWPFQMDLTPEIEKFKYKNFAAFVPETIDGNVAKVVGVGMAAVVLVLLVERFASSRHPKSD